MAREVLGITGAVIGGIYGGPGGAQVGFILGSAVGGIIDPPYFHGPKLGESGLQTSRDGIAIPVIWGEHHVVGNIIALSPTWDVEVKSSSKKGGTVRLDVRRYRTFAIGLGRGPYGPLTRFIRVWENNKLIYDLNDSGFTADNTKFQEETNYYIGSEDQLPDPALEVYSGVGTTPCYKGLAYIVFVAKDITDFTSAIPTYRFEMSSGVAFQSKDYPADP